MKKAITAPSDGQHADATLRALNELPGMRALWASFSGPDLGHELQEVDMHEAETADELRAAVRLATVSHGPAVITIRTETIPVAEVLSTFLAWASGARRKAGLSIVVPSACYQALHGMAWQVACVGGVLGVFTWRDSHHAIADAVREWELATPRAH